MKEYIITVSNSNLSHLRERRIKAETLEVQDGCLLLCAGSVVAAFSPGAWIDVREDAPEDVSPFGRALGKAA